MRILYHHRARSKDGQFVHIAGLVSALCAIGHEVEVVGPPAAERDTFGCEGGGVDILKRLFPPALYEVAELGYNALPLLRLWRAVLRRRPDVIYERYTLHLLAGIWLKSLLRVPLILEVNAPLAEERSRHGGLRLRRLAQEVERYIWRRADLVLPVTRPLAEMVRRAGVPDERIAVIPNGVAPEFLQAADGTGVRRRLGLDGATVLGFTGFVREWHGVDWVIDAIADIDPSFGLHLLLVGDGPALSDLRRRAKDRGVAHRMRFAGVIPREAVPEHVAAFDIALQPRAISYACPLKLVEYMAMGRAIVAPDQPNVRDLVGDAALLFAPEDRRCFAAAVERAAKSPELRARLAAKARAAAVAGSFSWEGAARRVSSLASRLAAGSAIAAQVPCPRPHAEGL